MFKIHAPMGMRNWSKNPSPRTMLANDKINPLIKKRNPIKKNGDNGPNMTTNTGVNDHNGIAVNPTMVADFCDAVGAINVAIKPCIVRR